MRGILVAFALVAVGLLEASPIVRESGVIYLSDFAMKPLRLKLAGPTPCYFDLAMTRFAGELRFPQEVQVEGVEPQARLLRVRGNARQGGVAAWIPFAAVQGLAPDFVAKLGKAEERRKEVEALIAKNEVAIGMTTDEVSQSLGKPQKKTQRASDKGTQQVWEYVKYQLVPQTTYVPANNQVVVPLAPGRTNSPVLVQSQPGYTASTIYVKVPIGQLAVTFRDGIVESLDQTEGTTSGGQISVVVPPVMVY